MKRDNVLSIIGIASKAGKAAGGEYQTEHAVKSHKAALVILAEDASENTKKKFQSMCDFYRTELIFYGNRESLGHCTGKGFRASVAITDKGLAQSVRKKLAQTTTE